MKRVVCIFLTVCILLSVTACAQSPAASNETPTTTVSTTTTTTTTTTTETTTRTTGVTFDITPADGELPLPKDGVEFWYSSGAGAWASGLRLYPDGTFTGSYQNTDAGESGEGYEVTIYTCTFSGRFDNITPQNDYSYTMTLADLKTEETEGEEWITDLGRFVAAEALGIAGGHTFVFYLPRTPIREVSDEFLSWSPCQYEQQEKQYEPLARYGILNLATQQGFFTCG